MKNGREDGITNAKCTYWVLNTALSLGLSLNKPLLGTVCQKEEMEIIYGFSSNLLSFIGQCLPPGLLGSATQPSGLGSLILPTAEQPFIWISKRWEVLRPCQSDQVWCQAAAGSSSAAPGAQPSLQVRVRQLIVLGGDANGADVSAEDQRLGSVHVLFNAIVSKDISF